MEECFLSGSVMLRCWTRSLFLLKFRNLCLVEVLPVVWPGIALGLLLENQFEIFIFPKADLCGVFLEPGCPSYNWLLSFALLLLGSNLPGLHTELLINSPVPAEEIVSREAVEKTLITLLKTAPCCLGNNKFMGWLKQLLHEQKMQTAEQNSKAWEDREPSNKTAYFVSGVLNSLLFSFILEVVKNRELRYRGGIYHLEAKLK